MIVRAMSVKSSTRIAAGVLAVYSILLLQVPLLNYLGYEFSTAIALILPLVDAWVTFSVFAHRSTPLDAGDSAAASALREAMGRSLALLLVPFGFATANMIVVKNCSYPEGIAFFLLIPAVTAVWTVAVAAFCIQTSRRYRTLYAACVIVILLYPVVIGYLLPQIFSYNLIYGFFPGFSYDEILTITPTLVLFRILSLLAAVLFVLLTLAAGRSGPRGGGVFRSLTRIAGGIRLDLISGSIIVLVVVLSAGWIFRSNLGFETTTARLREVLSSRFRTEHFEIRYAPGSFTDDGIRWVAAMHEFRFRQVAAALQVKGDEMITSYIYPDDETKRMLLGTATTNISKPWRREIHLGFGSWDGTLKHELVHILAGEFGMPVIKAHYHIGIVEGLAMAMDPEFGNRTLHQYARAIMKFGLVSDPVRLVKPIGFATSASSLSYVLMGSFCEFLIHRYGMPRFKQMYHGSSVEWVYGKTYETLASEWRSYLSRFTIPDEWRSHVQFYFRRPSIFAKECARTVARLNGQGYRELREKRPDAAAEEFSHALRVSWNTESYAGLIRSEFGAAQYDTVVHLVQSVRADSSHGSSLLNLDLLYGDALRKAGNDSSARSVYREILALDLSIPFDESAALRLAILAEDDLRAPLSDFFTQSLPESSALRLLNGLRQKSHGGLLAYLLGRTHFLNGRYDSAAAAFEAMPNEPADPFLAGSRERMLGESYLHLGQYAKARIHFWQSLNFLGGDAAAERVDDWLAQCDWFENNAGTYLKRPPGQ